MTLPTIYFFTFFDISSPKTSVNHSQTTLNSSATISNERALNLWPSILQWPANPKQSHHLSSSTVPLAFSNTCSSVIHSSLISISIPPDLKTASIIPLLQQRKIHYRPLTNPWTLTTPTTKNHPIFQSYLPLDVTFSWDPLSPWKHTSILLIILISHLDMWMTAL